MITLITARYVFPVAQASLCDGAVAVERDRIVAIGLATDLRTRYPDAREVALGDATLLPAAINAHTHLELTALAGMIPEGLAMADWILALLRARRALDDAALRASAREGARQTLASGVAAIGEICSLGASVAPIVESGLEGIIFLELLNGDPARADEALATGQAQLRQWSETYAGAPVRFGLALHAPYTVSAPLFQRASAWARAEGIPVSIHVAESPAESQWLCDRTGPIRDRLYATLGLNPDLEAAPGVSPVHYIRDLGALVPGALLAHAIQVDADDVRLIADADAVVVHCPHSNMRLLNGRLPWGLYHEAGVRMALGTDSLASAPSLSVWEEAAYAYRLHAAAGETPDPAELLRLATLSGAEALGVARDLGSLTEGKRARLAFAPLPAAWAPPEGSDGPAAAMAALSTIFVGDARVSALML